MTQQEISEIVREFEADYSAAFNRRDAAGLASLFTERATILTEWGDVVEGRDAFAESLSRAFANLTQKLKILNCPVRAAAVTEDVIVSHGMTLKFANGREEVLDFTRVLVRRDGHWQLAATHVSEPSSKPDPRAASEPV